MVFSSGPLHAMGGDDSNSDASNEKYTPPSSHTPALTGIVHTYDKEGEAGCIDISSALLFSSLSLFLCNFCGSQCTRSFYK